MRVGRWAVAHPAPRTLGSGIDGKGAQMRRRAWARQDDGLVGDL